MKLNSSKDFISLSSKNRPAGIPSRPQLFYKNKGWINWGEFLGSKVIAPHLLRHKYIKFRLLKKTVKNLKIKTSYEYKDYIKKGKFKFVAPANPDITPSYKKEWKGWPN
jgi:hypothetical protein